MLGFFLNPTEGIASESFPTSQDLPVGQAWSIEIYRFCSVFIGRSSTVNPPTFILNGPKRCWLSHPLKVVNAFKRLSLSGVQALICEDLWLAFSVMNSKKHVTEDKDFQYHQKCGKISLEVIPLPSRWHMYNIYSLLVLILFSTCWLDSPLEAWVAILLVTTTGEIMFKGILAPTMPTFCYHVRASWVWLVRTAKAFDDFDLFLETQELMQR